MDDINADESLDSLLKQINDSLNSRDIETIENNDLLQESIEPGLFDKSDLQFDFVEDFMPQSCPAPPPITDIYDKKWIQEIWPQLKTSRPSPEYPVLLQIVKKTKKRSYKVYWSDGKIRSGVISYKNFSKDEWNVTVNCDHYKDCFRIIYSTSKPQIDSFVYSFPLLIRAI